MYVANPNRLSQSFFYPSSPHPEAGMSKKVVMTVFNLATLSLVQVFAALAFDTRPSAYRSIVAKSEVKHPEAAPFFSGRTWDEEWEINHLPEPAILAQTIELRLTDSKDGYKLWAGCEEERSIALSAGGGTYTICNFHLIATGLTKEAGLKIIEEYEASASEAIREALTAKEERDKLASIATAEAAGITIRTNAADVTVSNVPQLETSHALTPGG